MKSAREIIEDGMIPQEAAKEIEKKKPAQLLVPMGTDGRFIINHHEDLKAAAAWAMHIKLAPAALVKEGVEAIMSALTVCHALKKPYTLMQYMFYYKGNITLFGIGFSSLAEESPNFGEKREYWVDKDYKKVTLENKNFGQEWAAVVEIKRKDSKEWNSTFFTMDDARKADLYPAQKNVWKNGQVVGKEDSPDSPWNKYTRDMLMWKARVRGYKANFAEALAGVECYEDVREVLEAKDVTPSSNNADELNSII